MVGSRRVVAVFLGGVMEIVVWANPGRYGGNDICGHI